MNPVVETNIFSPHPTEPGILTITGTLTIGEWWEKLQPHLPKSGNFIMPHFEYFTLTGDIHAGPGSKSHFPPSVEFVCTVRRGGEGDRIEVGYFQRDRHMGTQWVSLILGKHFLSRQYSFTVVEFLDGLLNGGNTEERMRVLRHLLTTDTSAPNYDPVRVLQEQVSAFRNVVVSTSGIDPTGKDVTTKSAVFDAKRILKWYEKTPQL
jgi:hypothetical protein